MSLINYQCKALRVSTGIIIIISIIIIIIIIISIIIIIIIIIVIIVVMSVMRKPFLSKLSVERKLDDVRTETVGRVLDSRLREETFNYLIIT